jgi:hypothetical protein
MDDGNAQSNPFHIRMIHARTKGVNQGGNFHEVGSRTRDNHYVKTFRHFLSLRSYFNVASALFASSAPGYPASSASAAFSPAAASFALPFFDRAIPW